MFFFVSVRFFFWLTFFFFFHQKGDIITKKLFQKAEKVMKNGVLLILSLIFVTSNIVSAQTAKRVITNDDLEKYRVKRETAESEYRRTYKERGMPSPEELEQREKESQK